MSNLIDLVTIKMELKMNGNFLAKVTLNWQDEFEVRFCRLTRKADGGLWFQPPSLKEFGYAKCFIVSNVTAWNDLSQKVIQQFKEELKLKVDEGVFPASALNRILEEEKQTMTAEELDKISNEIDKQITTYKN